MATTHARSAVSAAFGLCMSVMIAFFMAPFLLRELGALRFGIWALANTITGLYGFLDLGVRAAIEHRLTRAIGKRNIHYASRLFETAKHIVLRLAIAILGITIVVSTAFWVSGAFSKEARWEACVATLSLGSLAAAMFLFFPYTALISANRRYDVQNVLSIVERVLVAATIFCVVKFWPNLGALSLGHALPTFAMLLVRKRVANQLCELHSGRPSRLLRRVLFRTGVIRLTNALSYHVANQIDTITVTFVSGANAVAPYAIAASVATRLSHLAVVIQPTVFGHACHAFAERDVSTMSRLFLDGTRYCLLFALPPAIISCVCAEDFFRLWLSDGLQTMSFSPAKIYVLLAVATVSSLLAVVGTSVFVAAEELKRMARISVTEAAVNLSLSIVLGLFWGVYGVASATLIASVLIATPWRIWTACYVTETTHTRFIVESMLRPTACLLIFSILFLVRPGVQDIQSWGQLVLRGFGMLTAWTGLGMTIGISSHERLAVFRWLLRK